MKKVCELATASILALPLLISYLGLGVLLPSIFLETPRALAEPLQSTVSAMTRKKKKAGKKTILVANSNQDSPIFQIKGTLLRSGGKLNVCNTLNRSIEVVAINPSTNGGYNFWDTTDPIRASEGDAICGTLEINNETGRLQEIFLMDRTISVDPFPENRICVLPSGNCVSKVNASLCTGKESCCNDGIDNDNDGLSDCLDPDCKKSKSCKGCFTASIPAEFVFEARTFETDQSLCTAPAFVMWSDADDKRAKEWTVHYTLGPNDHSLKVEPEFNDSLTYQNEDASTTFTVPAGNHWVVVAEGGADAPDHLTADCSSFVSNYEGAFSNPSVEIKVCRKRKKKKQRK